LRQRVTDLSRSRDRVKTGRSRSDMPLSVRNLMIIGYRAFKDGRRVVVTGVLNRVMAAVSRRAPTAISMPISAFMMSAPER
jgi:hypothetical protein